MMFEETAKLEDLTPSCRRRRPRVRLLDDLVFEQAEGAIHLVITVPKGFISDLATTPWWLWMIFPPWGRWNRAAILHDYLCTMAADGLIHRFEADAIFRLALLADGVFPKRALVMYYGVRIYAIFHGKR